MCRVYRKEFIYHSTWLQHTLSAAEIVDVSRVLTAARFLAYCGAAGPVSKMASQQVKAFCVLRFEVSRSVIAVQREFRVQKQIIHKKITTVNILQDCFPLYCSFIFYVYSLYKTASVV
jgi:hypothetical protein